MFSGKINNMQLSKYFTLEDLTGTSTGKDNTPDVFAQGKLQQLAVLLDTLYETVGPFRVNSAYRSAAVNDAVNGSSTSLHLRGLAADLAPMDTSAIEYFKAILRSGLNVNMGEIIDESDRGVVHVSLPYDGKTNQIKYAANGTYYKYTQSQLNDLLNDQEIDEEESIVDGEADAVDQPSLSTPTLIMVVLAFSAIGYLVYSQTRQGSHNG